MYQVIVEQWRRRVFRSPKADIVACETFLYFEPAAAFASQFRDDPDYTVVFRDLVGLMGEPPAREPRENLSVEMTELGAVAQEVNARSAHEPPDPF